VIIKEIVRWVVLSALILAAGAVWGEPPDVNEPPPPATRGGFPWFVAPKTTTGTQVLPDFERIWREDGVREERKESAYWAALRTADEALIRDRYRAETQIALQRAVAAALQKASREKRLLNADNEDVRGGDQDAFPQGDPVPGTTEENPGENGNVAASASGVTETFQQAANNVLKDMDRVAGELVVSSPNQATSASNRGFVFFLMLLAVFLVPTVGISLLLLAFLQLRHGHRLQSALFGLAGCAMLGLVFAARQEMRAQDPAEQRAEIARVRAMCQASAVRLDGFVYSAIPGGAVVTDVKGTQVDEYGWAVVLTEKQAAHSGERWKLQVYPIGVHKAENALGLVRALPAYADSLDAAVTLRAEAEREADQWWWQRMLRSIREA
jgi:hypothetical protein